ncbi:MAG TPA: benzoyl-CoA-dihydrodiol lyase, partial [Planctomycetota bacterium]|nr:benzoyl-CoA-dihydrodiol lyase [Planctomycetota bacterium]
RSIAPKIDGDRFVYRHVELTLEPVARTASLTVRGPERPTPKGAEALFAEGADLWALRAFRELDDALLRLRMNHPEIGVVRLSARGDANAVLEADRALHDAKAHWFVRETLLLQARVLRRLDATAKSLFALVEPGTCFAGSLLELALAADRIYVKDDPKSAIAMGASALNGGAYPMSHGLTRLEARFVHDPPKADQVLKAAEEGLFDAERADELGLATFVFDEIDFDDEVRVAVEERASLSPDALTGMEASLRFPGPENCDSKIFGRLTAWQNWIFQRPNAVGPNGALTNYGQPVRPTFDYRRT